MPVQFDDEACLQDNARSVEKLADRYQGKSKWNWSKRGKSESDDFLLTTVTFFAETKDPILKMFGDATGNLMKRGLVRKEDRVEMIS